MVERNPASPGEDGPPIPRDLPDQQASDDSNDPWELDIEVAAPGDEEKGADDDVPDTDEAGTDRRDTSDDDVSLSEDPPPEEPTA
ncbi:hypothetical protein ABZ383_19220 [Streptomyces sp. NPDC005900]|uniref:hypothetical protein n=1 Tax=Streptomyces sp. NPDC005900 TaxID=3154569 RepID=UPI0033FEC940